MVMKRLFISTGFYSTLIASVVAEMSEEIYEDHLLITMDRQSSNSNVLWAHRLHSWKTVETIDHTDYYIERINYRHSIDWFDEVYSPFPEMILVITEAFPSKKYSFYEEGLTSYLQFLEGSYDENFKFYCLHPHVFNDLDSLISLPISIPKTREKLRSLDRCYRVPLIENNNNIIVIGQGGFPDENKNSLIRGEYVKFIKEQSRLGFNIILLGHTRLPADKKLIDELENSVETNFTYIEHAAPISDLFILKNIQKIRVIAGVYSTLLVNSETVCGIPAVVFDSGYLSERQVKLRAVQSLLMS
jgi:hypothetical protein